MRNNNTLLSINNDNDTLLLISRCIRLSEKFLSFRTMMIDEQQFLFYIILFRYISIITFAHNSIN